MIGAPWKDGAASREGRAYVRTFSSGAWASGTPLQAQDPGQDDFFGNSVGISGGLVIVGAPGAESSDGLAFIFDGENSWSRVTLENPTAIGSFGHSVAIEGNVAVVGAYAGSGVAVVFELDQGDWTDVAVLTKDSGSNGDEFGRFTSISGDVIVVGAPGVGGHQEGAAYVFVKPGGGWTTATQDAELTASDEDDNAFFGYGVSISGDRIVVGAFGAEQTYVFDKPGGGWADATQDAVLQPCGAAAVVDFGFSVAVDGDLIVVGARHGNPDDFGAALVYQYFSGSDNWEFIQQVSADDGADNDLFAWSVAISDDFAVAGAPSREVNATPSDVTAGAIYEFEDVVFR